MKPQAESRTKPQAERRTKPQAERRMKPQATMASPSPSGRGGRDADRAVRLWDLARPTAPTWRYRVAHNRPARRTVAGPDRERRST